MLQHVSVPRSFLWVNNIPLYGYATFVYPLTCQWAFRLFTLFSYCKECCSDCACTCICLSSHCQFLWVWT